MMRRPRTDEAAPETLETLRAGAPRQSTNVRALARFAANSRCPSARLGFAARVDYDLLLAGTAYAAPFGQSPFAFRRGNRFEERLRDDDYRPMLDLLREGLGYATADARVANLRDGRPTPTKLAERAGRTAALVAQVVGGDREAPNLIDGAVLTREIGGVTSYFEADAVAARFAEPIYAGEIKSFPTVDGQADPEKLGAALAQVSIYILLLRELVARGGGDPSLVSADALIITPRNTGLQPTMTVKSVGREVDRAARILDGVPDAAEFIADLPPDLPRFDSMMAREGRSESERVENALCVVETVGNVYQPGCLTTCGFGRLCRERAHTRGDLDRIGGQFARILPGVSSIDRAGELARGAAPDPEEAAAAGQLRLARSLVDDFARPASPRVRGGTA